MTNAIVLGYMSMVMGLQLRKFPWWTFMLHAGNPNFIHGIIDCWRYMSGGVKKDRYFIFQQMVPKMCLLDPNKNRFHKMSFDGASNIQKMGCLIVHYSPWCTVSTRVEHTVSLLSVNHRCSSDNGNVWFFPKSEWTLLCPHFCTYSHISFIIISFAILS